MLSRIASAPRPSRYIVALIAAGALLVVDRGARRGARVPAATPSLVEPPVGEAARAEHHVEREVLPDTGCPDSVAMIGTRAEALQPGELLIDTDVASDGCTIAAWTSRTLYVTWNGGATFTALALAMDHASAHVAADRLVVVDRDLHRIGVMHRGDAAPAWRPFPDLPLAEHAFLSADASAHWIAVATDARIALSDDDARTWRYLALPAATDDWSASLLDGVTDDGTVTATAYQRLDDSGEVTSSRTIRARVPDGVWRDATPAPGWSYTFALDDFWGCGGTSKLLAHHGRTERTLAGHLGDDGLPLSLAASATAAYAMLPDGFVRLRGATMIDLPLDDAALGARLVGVDHDGTAILRQDSRLLRWSKLGGWRELMNASPE
jgi:hypothetical protein